MLESKWVIIDILVVTPFEIHPIQVRFGYIESISGQMLKINHWLVFHGRPDNWILEVLAPIE